jgi:MoaA/NifB/PqqE/SkfB family radical SAM enzyme
MLETRPQPWNGDISACFHHYTPRAEHPDWSALYAEALSMTERICPGLEAPVPRWRYFQRQLRAVSTLLRNHLANRRLARQGREDFWPFYFIWTTHRACNFSCRYCDDHRGNKYPDLSNRGVLDTAQAIRMLRIMRTRTPAVLMSGGEPTLRSDLPLLTRAARELHFYPIIMNTNGSRLHQLLQKPLWHTWLADLDHLVVSLDALDTAVLGRMWDYRHSEDVLCNILILRELAEKMRFKLMISTVIQPGAVDHARDVLNFCNDLGICFCPMPVNVGPAIEASLLSDSAYDELIELILERKRSGYLIAGSERLNRRMLQAEILQCRNTLKPHIDYDGHLLWPCKGSVNVTPIKIPTLDFPDIEALYAHGRRLIDPTGFQERCGARCNWSQNYTTDAYAYGLSYTASIFKEVVGFLRAL